MKNTKAIPKFKVTFDRFASAEEITDKVVDTLKQGKKNAKPYREDLMYRGVWANTEEDYKAIGKYGTDHNPETQVQATRESLNQTEMSWLSSDFDLVMENEEDSYQDHLDYRTDGIKFTEQSKSPSQIWALPEQGLDRCVETYAFDKRPGQIAAILAYRPETMVNDTISLDISDKEPKEIDQEALLDESNAVYRLKEGITAKDACVASIRLEEK